MCDTFIALPAATANRTAILGKNSDREPDEAQAIVSVPSRTHAPGEKVKCTFIEIPEIAETYACILSKPFQMWGAEMGVNEWGVAIGNEAVFTRVKKPKRNDGLTGMDMLRLALERSRSAAEALGVITHLLGSYGQDACGGYRNRSFFYDNSFIVADPNEAWVLETAGREWAARRVSDIASISNRLALNSADRYSHGAKEHAKHLGWWDGRSSFDFAKAYSDKLYTWLGRGAQRQACTLRGCEARRGQLTAGSALEILQAHNLDDSAFTPRKATTASVCMHRTSLLNPSDTTGSMVAELRSSGIHTVWLTGTSHPCLSIYIPFFLGTRTLEHVTTPGKKPDGSLWWQAKRLHDWVARDYISRKSRLDAERKALQSSFLELERQLFVTTPTRSQLEELSNYCLKQALDSLEKWTSGIKVEVKSL